MRRPSRRPITAVTNSAVDSSCTPRTTRRAGTTVRYGSRENPRTDQAISQATMIAPAPGTSLKRDASDVTRTIPTSPPRAAPSTRIDLITGGQPSIGGRASAIRTGRSGACRRARRPRPIAARIASRSDATSMTSRPGTLGAVPRAGGARSRARTRGARPRGAAARSRPRAQLAEEAHLADRDGARRDRPVAEGAGQGDRERQVQPGLRDLEAAGEVRVDVLGPEGDPGAPAEDGDEQGEPVGVQAGCTAGRRPVAGRRDERLDLDEQRPRPLHRGRDDAPRSRRLVLHEECPGWIGDLGHAALAQLEDADLLGRAEPVLRGPQDAQHARSLAAELEDGIHEVLEGLGAGDRAVLRHVAHEDDGDPLALCQLHEPERRLADLPDAAGRPVELVNGGGLDRVDDDEGGPRRARHLDDPARPRSRRARAIGGPGDAVEQAEAAGPKADLRGALLPGGVQDGARGPIRPRHPPLPGAGASTCPRRARRRGGRATRAPARRPGRGPARRSRSSAAARRPSRRRPAGPARPHPGPGALRAARSARVGSRTTVSTREFQPPQARHWPSQRRNDSPQVWQTYRLPARATGG